MVRIRYNKRYTTKNQIREIAFAKNRENGLGITYEDLVVVLRVPKHKAQRTLKHLHVEKFLFTAQDLKKQGITIKGIERENPQRYYLTEMQSTIIESRKKSVLKDTTGTYPSKVDLLKSQSFQDVLTKLYPALLFIHNMQLETFTDKKYYYDLNIKPEPVNKAKIIEDNIGFVKGICNVKFLVYPNGTIMIHIKNSENPFRIVSEEDIVHIMTFLGRVEERLHAIFDDPKDRIVPPVRFWVLKECDVNKDTEIDDLGQITLPDIQIPLVDKALRGYVKPMNGHAYYRVEFSIRPEEYVKGALERIRKGVKIDERTITP